MEGRRSDAAVHFVFRDNELSRGGSANPHGAIGREASRESGDQARAGNLKHQQILAQCFTTPILRLAIPQVIFKIDATCSILDSECHRLTELTDS